MTVLVVTGTGTGVGKTVATAALACRAARAGLDVAVCKPLQTGTADGDDDLAEVGRLAGITALHGLARYPEPLAPKAAAQRVGARLPTDAELVDFVAAVDRPGRLTLVEGAGGLLVTLSAGGGTLRDLAAATGAAVLVVAAAGLGTLNHTTLTLEALDGAGLACAGLVIGSWPAVPGPAELTNRDELAALAPVRAVLPAGAGASDAGSFAALCDDVVDGDWLGTLVR
ncbi:dethiobiotin synthase [Mycobacterium sp. MYCO198283]|uniref:dethiobiotin synthase n=1 Tax=Mycobacterium sp. MYCO198283 TaxID=2883505 RepID=UPI001E5B614E|nr:dethiobiotin synthase [Mycobacterium sp. MYCO198283]MCG5433522.1 dethiobiotin synthase [Mycobacterium sp. MYCO198283]